MTLCNPEASTPAWRALTINNSASFIVTSGSSSPDSTYMAALEAVRDNEIAAIVPLLGPPARLLEIGAGSGWQARHLEKLGHRVDAIEVSWSEYTGTRVFPIVEYDGHRIPFPDGSFDVVFSSNVMEHIPHVVEFQKELLRVLRPGGLAVHAVPSATWRLWTSLAHYPWLAQQISGRLLGAKSTLRTGPRQAEAPQATVAGPRASLLRRIATWAIPERHGERGSMPGELWIFSRLAWRRLFTAAGFREVRSVPLGLFYTGYLLGGTNVSTSARQQLSALLGSSCVAFVMRSPDQAG